MRSVVEGLRSSSFPCLHQLVRVLQPCEELDAFMKRFGSVAGALAKLERALAHEQAEIEASLCLLSAELLCCLSAVGALKLVATTCRRFAVAWLPGAASRCLILRSELLMAPAQSSFFAALCRVRAGGGGDPRVPGQGRHLGAGVGRQGSSLDLERFCADLCEQA